MKEVVHHKHSKAGITQEARLLCSVQSLIFALNASQSVTQISIVLVLLMTWFSIEFSIALKWIGTYRLTDEQWISHFTGNLGFHEEHMEIKQYFFRLLEKWNTLECIWTKTIHHVIFDDFPFRFSPQKNNIKSFFFFFFAFRNETSIYREGNSCKYHENSYECCNECMNVFCTGK